MSKSPWYNSDGRVGVGQISTYIPYRGDNRKVMWSNFLNILDT